ncbi:hypothetical protein ABZ897_43000 [Nonomuraea sp. NPDC046802]|uniref:hypothetical protein n=1 Tax=Nonomuraea sp. NPDC046802 TaxID=3154919 RepID=UPI0033D1E122
MSPSSGADLARSAPGAGWLATMHSFGVPVPAAVDQPAVGATTRSRTCRSPS